MHAARQAIGSSPSLASRHDLRAPCAALHARLASFADTCVQTGVPLATIARWRIGGPADLVVEPRTQDALAQTLRALNDAAVPFLVIGDGSNLLFDDAGYRGVILRIGRSLSRIFIEGERVTAEAGIWTPHFARKIGGAGLTGVEHVVGIPGTLGGLLVMNGGSLRKAIGSHVMSVTCLDMAGQRLVFHQDTCGFAYRTSAFQTEALVVVEAEFALKRGDTRASRRMMLDIMAARKRKFPLRLPNCGSVFLSNPAMYDVVGPPGLAIERVGLRGRRIGNAQIAPEHGNFIVNLGNASSAHVLSLIHLARNAVHAQTNFWMDCEVRYVSPHGQVCPAHLVA